MYMNCDFLSYLIKNDNCAVIDCCFHCLYKLGCRVSDCYLMPIQQFFSYTMMRTS